MKKIDHSLNCIEVIDTVTLRNSQERRISHLISGPHHQVKRVCDKLFEIYPKEQHGTTVVAANAQQAFIEMVIHRAIPTSQLSSKSNS